MPWVVHVLSLPSNELEYAEKIPRVKDYHRCQDELREKEDINVGTLQVREKNLHQLNLRSHIKFMLLCLFL